VAASRGFDSHHPLQFFDWLRQRQPAPATQFKTRRVLFAIAVQEMSACPTTVPLAGAVRSRIAPTLHVALSAIDG